MMLRSSAANEAIETPDTCTDDCECCVHSLLLMGLTSATLTTRKEAELLLGGLVMLDTGMQTG